jgi:murein endopeptidase
MGGVRLLGLVVLLALAAPTAAPAMVPDLHRPQPLEPVMTWRPSQAVGLPFAGRLTNGVQLPAEGLNHWTFDWGTRAAPNRGWRRWGTARLVQTVLDVLREFRFAHPTTPRVGVADLSRPHGGPFGRKYGGLGHASHQNGLDADVIYPRLDRTELPIATPAEVDRVLAQELVDRFVAAGAVKVFVGPRLGLRGPRGVVVALPNHDDHLHVRIR